VIINPQEEYPYGEEEMVSHEITLGEIVKVKIPMDMYISYGLYRFNRLQKEPSCNLSKYVTNCLNR
jgi:hypothetical protein